MVSTVSLLPLSAAVLSTVLIVITAGAPRRKTLPARLFSALNICTLLWSAGYFIQLNWLTLPDPSLARFGTGEYVLLLALAIGISGAPTYWLLFTAASAHSRFWTGRFGKIVAYLPMVYSIAVIATNPWHEMFVSLRADGDLTYGALAPAHYIFSLLWVAIGWWLLVHSAWARGTAQGRRQAVVLGIASALPMLGGLLWSTRRLTGLPIPINLSPVLFPVLNVVLAYAVIRGQLADIIPVSTLTSILDNTDAYLAYLDPEFRFSAVNSAFLQRTRHSEEEILGHDFFELFPTSKARWLFESVRETGKPVEERADRTVFGAEHAALRGYWDWSLSPVYDQQELQGLVLSLMDVSDSVREQELTEEMNRVNARIHSGFVCDETLREVVADAAVALGCETSSIVVLRDRQWLIMQHCEREDADWEPFNEADFPHIRAGMQELRPIVSGNVRTDERLNAYLMKALGIRSTLVVPLISHREPIGAVSFDVHSTTVEFSGPQIDFAKKFAGAVTVALENARLYEGERRIAETLQTSMLTLPDELPGIDFAHIYRSATESARVGGDFYDLFELDGDRVGILIGDVAGHGLGAAVLTSLIKNTIRAHAFQEASPALVMERTNETVRKQTDPSSFATVFFGVLERETRVLRYCSAGHPPALIVGSGHELVRLPATSLILGAFGDIEFAEERVELPPGKLLVLYTDGVTEARSDGALFGEMRLSEVLSALTPREPQAAVDAVFADVMRFTQHDLSDDLALLAVRVQGAA